MADTSSNIVESATFLPKGTLDHLKYPEWPTSGDGCTRFAPHCSPGQGAFWLALSRGSDHVWRSGYRDHRSGCEWKPVSEQKPSDFWFSKNARLREEACVLAEMEMLSMVRVATVGYPISRMRIDSGATVLVTDCVPSIIKHSNRNYSGPYNVSAWKMLSNKLAGIDGLTRLGAISTSHPALVVLMRDASSVEAGESINWEILNLDTGGLTTIYHTGNSNRPSSITFNMTVTQPYAGRAPEHPTPGHVMSLVSDCLQVKAMVAAGSMGGSQSYRPDMGFLHLLLSHPQ